MRSSENKLKDISNITKNSRINGVHGLKKPNLDSSTVDVGALMKKALAYAPPSTNSSVAGGGSVAAGNREKKTLELRGNPVYSPEDSHAVKADEMDKENLPSGGLGNATPAAAKQQQQTTEGRPRLAAMSVISKRNRRKSVFQRPSRYGDWFDGDDDELEKMVEDFNESDEDESGGLKQERKRDNGEDIAKKVHDITNGLCSKLDTLIEESPAHDSGYDKSLRDQLLESWQGKSYYDRLMEIAASGGNGGLSAKDMIQKSLKHAAQVKATENEPKSPDPEEGSDTQKSLLSPPKKSKPVVDVELPMKDMIAESLHREQVEQAKKAKLKSRRQTEGPGLLKVSARGLRPMPAPWETEDMGKKEDSSDSCQQSTAAGKMANAPQAYKTKEDIDAICRKKDMEIEELKAKVDAAMQEAKDYEEANNAANSQIAKLEKELDMVQKQQPDGKSLAIFAEKAIAMEKKYGDMEIQLEALTAAIATLTTHIKAGRCEANELVAMFKTAGNFTAPDSKGRKTRSTARRR